MNFVKKLKGLLDVISSLEEHEKLQWAMSLARVLYTECVFTSQVEAGNHYRGDYCSCWIWTVPSNPCNQKVNGCDCDANFTKEIKHFSQNWSRQHLKSRLAGVLFWLVLPAKDLTTVGTNFYSARQLQGESFTSVLFVFISDKDSGFKH